MRQASETITVATRGRGLYEMTDRVTTFVADAQMEEGLLTVYCRHTSCSLLIQENADPDVRADLETFLDRLVPEGADWITHTAEGPDDMPAHIKAALNQTSLSIPVAGGQPVLGTWQGLYLFEHRRMPHRRQIVLHLLGAS